MGNIQVNAGRMTPAIYPAAVPELEPILKKSSDQAESPRPYARWLEILRWIRQEWLDSGSSLCD